MKRETMYFIGLVCLLVVLSACAPKAVSVPSPTTPAATPSKAVATPSAEETAWNKIVEAAQKEGKVTIYANTMQADVGLAVSKGFKDRYGITVDILIVAPPAFSERIAAEKRIGERVVDVVETSSTNIALNLRDILTPAGVLPVLREKGVWLADPTALDPEKKANLIWRLFETPPFVNTRLVKPEEAPKSWKDWLDPRWKGKIIIREPRLNIGMYDQIVGLMDKNIWDEDYLKALYRQELLFRPGVAESFTSLASGERGLIFNANDAEASRFIKEGASIKAISMREGMMAFGGAIAGVSGGPHPNATLLLLNWLLGTEGQTAYGKNRGARMARSDVPEFRSQGAWVEVNNRIFFTAEQSERSSKLYKEGWFDKLVGR